MSHLVKNPYAVSFAEVKNIARVESVNKAFRSRCWRVIKQVDFNIGWDGNGAELVDETVRSWLPSDMAVILIFWKKCRNLREVTVASEEFGGRATNTFLRGIWELQHEDSRNIQSLFFWGPFSATSCLPTDVLGFG